jgi:hypothetical protein
MKTSKTTLVLTALCVVGGLALVARFFSGPAAPAAKPASVATTGSASAGSGDNRPGTAVRSTRTLKLDRSANVIPDLDKEALTRELTPKEALESKFRNFRDEGRQQFEAIFQGDQDRTRAAMRSLFQNEEFRGIFQQSRALGEKWGQANDQEKVAIMAQMQALRDRGLGMARAEAARQTNGGDGGSVTLGLPTQAINNSGTITLPADGQPAPAAPAAPAPAPVIIM